MTELPDVGQSDRGMSLGQCHYCGAFNHFSSQCPDFPCPQCGRPDRDHSPGGDCPVPDLPLSGENARPLVDAAYCERCGRYMPLTLDGARRVHECERTKPLDDLPFGICACPVCGGYGRSRWGCWGSREHPHEHAFMIPIHELVAR